MKKEKINLESILNSNTKSFYVFDIDVLKERIKYLRDSLPEKISLCYAVKANTFVTEYIVNEVERFEICSPGENRICEKQGVPTFKMVISGVYKDPYFIEELMRNDLFHGIFTIESKAQYELISRLSNDYKKEVRLLLRLTNDSQFGLDQKDLEEIVSKNVSDIDIKDVLNLELDKSLTKDDQEQKNAETSKGLIKIIGIQYFTGTQKTSIKKFARELRLLEKLLLELREKYLFIPEEIEYGTGFPVAYFEDENIDEKALLKSFSELINDFSFKGNITLEIGRSFVASCGKYYTHIVDMKTNKNQNYIMVDGGMHQVMFYGQHMSMRKPYIELLTKRISGNSWEILEENSSQQHVQSSDSTEIDNAEVLNCYNIAGSLCTMNDILVKQKEFKNVEIGDVLRFGNAGGYSMHEGMSLFLSRDLPAIYISETDESGNVDMDCLRNNFETYNLNMRI